MTNPDNNSLKQTPESTSPSELNKLKKRITELCQTEQNLNTLVTKHETLLSAIPDIIMEVNENKVYTWANQAGYKFFGNDVLGKEANYFFEGEQSTYEKVAPLFAGEENVFYVESWQRRQDGAKRLLSWWCRVLKDTEGNVTGALSTARDITNQKELENSLKTSEKKYRTLHENMRDALIGFDLNGKIIETNSAFQNILGYSENELYSLTNFDITPKKQHGSEKQIINQILKTGYSDIWEKEYTKKNGAIVPVELTCYTTKNEIDNSIVIWGIVRDMTKHKQMETMLRKKLDKSSNSTIAKIKQQVQHFCSNFNRKIK